MDYVFCDNRFNLGDILCKTLPSGDWCSQVIMASRALGDSMGFSFMDLLRLRSSNPIMAIFSSWSFPSSFTRRFLIGGSHPGWGGGITCRGFGLQGLLEFGHLVIKFKELFYSRPFTRAV